MASLSVSERGSESATAELHVCLLGPPSLAWQGEPLTLPRRQARALLFYLAAAPQAVTRDHLCLLFWPDATETTARCNLSRLVSILHDTLPDPALLITSDDQIGLTRSGVQSDLQTFDLLWGAWKAGGQPSCLQQAVALYRGPFLEGFSLPDCPEYEAWITTERQRWERLALQALAALVEDLAAKGEYASAISDAQRYLAIDDLSEEIHRRLIELYALAGDRAAAARQYEHLVAVLERELGLDPLPETQALYRAVQAGGAPPRINPTPSAIKAHLLAPDVPLVGREEAWRALEEAYARARSGRGQFVLITGEAGIGKSRLMQDFCDHLAARVCPPDGRRLSRDADLSLSTDCRGVAFPVEHGTVQLRCLSELAGRGRPTAARAARAPSGFARATRERAGLGAGAPVRVSGDDPGRHGSRPAARCCCAWTICTGPTPRPWTGWPTWAITWRPGGS